MGERQKVILIYHHQFENWLKESIAQNIEILQGITISGAFLCDEEKQDLQKASTNADGVKFCVAIVNWDVKQEILAFLKARGILGENIFDVYKAYKANFSRKRYQRILDARKGESLDGLILGISHGLTGIDESLMPGNVCNLCESSQDIYFNYRLFECVKDEYYDMIKDLKYVVIDMFDYNYFNFDTIQTGACIPFFEESGFLCEERLPWNKENSVEEINRLVEGRWQEGNSHEEQELLRGLFPYLFDKDKGAYKGDAILSERRLVLSEAEISAYQKEPYMVPVQTKVFEDTVTFQIDNFDKLLESIKEINPSIRIYLVLLPKYWMVEYLEQVIHNKWRDFFYTAIDEFKQKYSAVELLDLKDVTQFSKQQILYFDKTHFNCYGAEIFTKYLSRLIQGKFDLFNQKGEELAVNQLLDALDANLINEDTIKDYCYYHLLALMRMAEKLPGGKESYIRIKTHLEAINIRRLRKQEKIIVGFIANYSSTWIGDEFYRLLEQSERFEPYVFLMANHNGQSKEMILESYAKELAFFRSRNVRVVETLNPETAELYSWEQMGIKPQLCIWLTPWIYLFREHFILMEYSLDTVHAYIPYGIRIAENKQGTYIRDHYDQFINNLVWRNWAESKKNAEMAEEYAFVGKSNVVYTGYPKMDPFFRAKAENQGVWRTFFGDKAAKAKKVIYAPHHTLEENDLLLFSTFASNGMFMLELAQKYQEETLWVFKPHPHLGYKAVKAGLFQDIAEWEAYVQKWRDLKNAVVVECGTYEDLFMNSDAMILDSVSFLAEYLYVHKPLLLLTREEQAFNDFGNQIVESHYCAEGTDTAAIEAFLQEVVLKENDCKKEEREKVFAENLDYTILSGKNAAENILKDILQCLD